MSDSSFGIIEIGLAFGGLLAWAVWELVRNRRELARLRARDARERADPPA